MRGPSILFVIIVASVPVVGACKSNSISSNTTNNFVSMSIGPSGGSFTGPENVRVDFPAGAVPSTTTFTLGIAANIPAAPNGATYISSVFSFEPHNFTFAGPVTVSIPLLGGASSGTVWHATCVGPEQCNAWDASPVANVNFNSINGVFFAVFPTSSFSIYAVTSGGGNGGDASGPGMDSGGPGMGGSACDEPSVSGSQCFMQSNVQCMGIGTNSCTCQNNPLQAQRCQGSKGGSAPCIFYWSCNGATEGCNGTTIGSDAGAGMTGTGGVNCTSICATQASAAQEMANATSGCGKLTGP
jgi:hypothetical protein